MLVAQGTQTELVKPFKPNKATQVFSVTLAQQVAVVAVGLIVQNMVQLLAVRVVVVLEVAQVVLVQPVKEQQVSQA